MAHLSPEQLAGLATDPCVVLAPAEGAHLDQCRSCAAQAAELEDLVREVGRAGAIGLRPPGPEVWARIEQRLDKPLRTPRQAGLPSRWLRPAVAAAAGLVLGVAGTFGVLSARSSDGRDLVAQTSLAALPGEAGQGTAELVRTADTLQLRVHASLATSPTNDFHEVWLINADGRRMYALGVLPSSGDASYWLPAPLGAELAGYSTVDISLEPEDGNAAHSRHSLVQGHLPG